MLVQYWNRATDILIMNQITHRPHIYVYRYCIIGEENYLKYVVKMKSDLQ